MIVVQVEEPLRSVILRACRSSTGSSLEMQVPGCDPSPTEPDQERGSHYLGWSRILVHAQFPDDTVEAHTRVLGAASALD